jgi:membrane protein
MWMWMSAIVVLFGAELNSEIERQAAINAPVGSPRPRAAATTASPAIRDRQVPVAAKH